MNGSVQDTFHVSVGWNPHHFSLFTINTKHKQNQLHATPQSQQQNVYLLLVLLEFYLQCQYGQPQHSSMCLDLDCAPAKKKKKKESQRFTLCSTCVCQGVFQDAVKAAFSKPTPSSSAFLKGNDHNYSFIHSLINFKPAQSLHFLCIQETWI